MSKTIHRLRSRTRALLLHQWMRPIISATAACALLLTSPSVQLVAADSTTSSQDASMPGMDMGGMDGMGGTGNSTGSAAASNHLAPSGTGSQGEPTLPDGLRLLPYRTQNGYKVFHLTAKPVWWDSGSGQKQEAWAYNGTVPGPEIRVNTGDRVKIVVENKLPNGTTIHWQGMNVPFPESGMGGISQPDIAPNQSFTYAFTVIANPGAYLYRAMPSMGILSQNSMGLWGPLIVEPKGTAWKQVHPGYQNEYTLVVNDSGDLGYTLNGKSFPATTVLQAHLHDKVLIHLIDTGSMEHPMHLHGLHFQEIAQDGDPLPIPITMDTISIEPGTTYDIQLTASQVGQWLFHCHIVDHVVNAAGHMTGLVTFLKVTK